MNENNLEIIKHEVDWLKLIKMAFKKKDWGKTYTLYKNKDVRVECSMRQFNFDKNYATFKLNCVYINDKYSCSAYNYELLEYYLDNYTVEDFKRLVLRKVETLLTSVIKDRLTNIAQEKYYDLYVWYADIDKDMIKSQGYGDDYNEIQSITNIAIRNKANQELEHMIHSIANADYNAKVDQYKILLSYKNY